MRHRVLYDELAEIYDRWLTGDPVADPCLAFYADAMRGCDGRVLEMGVGTGRVMTALRAVGARPVGVDLSIEMLRRAPATGQTACADALCLPFDAVFDVVILPMRTLGHFIGPDEPIRLFREVQRVLRPGGRFVFDHYRLDRDWAEAHDGVEQLMYEVTADGRTIKVWDRYAYDFASQQLTCQVRIDESPAQQPGPEVVQFTFRWFERSDLERLADDAGLVVEHRWGGYDRSPLTDDSDHFVFVLRRP